MSGKFKGAKVAVVAGGLSAEREVSLATGEAIAGALRERGYDIAWIDASRELPWQLREAGAEAVFIALHGTYGEDGRIQGLLDWMGLPYTGSDARASLLAMDKALAKALFRMNGVPVAADQVLRAQDATVDAVTLPLPAVVKPVAEGSSVGVSLVRQPAELGPALEAAADCGDVLIETFIDGPELSVVCLGDEALGAVEVEATRTFYDYDAKYAADGGTVYHLPPRVDPALVALANERALAAHRALGCSGVTRTDLMVAPDGPLVLEVNTVPGMTATSLVPKVAAQLGWSFADVCERILDLATWGPKGEAR